MWKICFRNKTNFFALNIDYNYTCLKAVNQSKLLLWKRWELCPWQKWVWVLFRTTWKTKRCMCVGWSQETTGLYIDWRAENYIKTAHFSFSLFQPSAGTLYTTFYKEIGFSADEEWQWWVHARKTDAETTKTMSKLVSFASRLPPHTRNWGCRLIIWIFTQRRKIQFPKRVRNSINKLANFTCKNKIARGEKKKTYWLSHAAPCKEIR